MSVSLEQMSQQFTRTQMEQAERQRTELGQDAFLRLMTEQLKYQDPLSPLDNAEFVSQMAQFSSVKGLQELQTSFNTLANNMTANQGLQAAALIGHDALIPADRGSYDGDTPVDGAVWADGPGWVVVEVKDAAGNLVRRVSVEATTQGDTAFSWDGTDQSGAPVPAGEYSFKASFIDSGGQMSDAIPMLSGRIDSVVLSSQGLVLNLAGLGPVPLSAVRRIG